MPIADSSRNGDAMPIAYEIDRSKDLTIFRFSGEVVVDDLIQTIYDYFSGDYTNFEIYDLRGFDGSPLLAGDIEKLSHFIRSRSGKFRLAGKTAIVAPRDIDFGNSRMLAFLTEIDTPYEFRVFRSIEKAYDWLKLSP